MMPLKLISKRAGGNWMWIWIQAGVMATLALCGCQAPSRIGRVTPLKPHASQSARSVATAPSAVATTGDSTVWRRETAKWMGTPYRFGGTDHKGIDCSAFVCQVYRGVTGKILPRTTTAQFQIGSPVPQSRLHPGDLVFFKTTDQQPVSHVGIWLGNGEFAHASTSRGVIISSLNQDYYARRYRGARRVLRAP